MNHTPQGSGFVSKGEDRHTLQWLLVGGERGAALPGEDGTGQPGQEAKQVEGSHRSHNYRDDWVHHDEGAGREKKAQRKKSRAVWVEREGPSLAR